MQINVAVTDANNIVCTVVPPQTQTITIDRGVAGNGIVSIVPVTISTFQYLRITYTNGTVSDVGPLTSTAYTATAPISIVGNTISLLTVPIASGGTAATTAAAAIQNLLPSYTGNGSKRLGLNSGATALEWVADGGGTVTSVALSGGSTGLTTSGGPITSSGTITLAGTLAIANGGTGQTTAAAAITALTGSQTNAYYLRSNGTNATLSGLAAADLTGTVSIATGGSGQNTAQAAMNAFAGAVTSGSYLRGNGTNVVMATIQAADVPTLNQNTTGTATNITATSNSTLITLSSLSLPGSQVTGNISGNAVNVTGTVAIANGGTGQTTANAAFNALAPSQTGNSGKYLTTDGTNTSWATNPLGTVTSVSGTGTVSGLTLSGTVTTSGSLTLGGTLDLSAYNGAGAFTTLSASSTVTLSGGTANGVAYLNGSKVLTTGSALTYDGTTFTSGAHTLSTGNLNFSSTAQRITGNFSSATHSNRLLFQDSTTNGASVVGVIPNGAGVSSAYNAYAAADPTNTSIIQIRVGTDTSDARITSGITGTGTYQPITFYTGGSERVRIDTSGNVGIGANAPSSKLSFGANIGLDFAVYEGAGGANKYGIGMGGAGTTPNPYRTKLYANGVEYVSIDTNGLVGIGTSSPAALLDINGSSGWAGGTTGNVANIKGANATVTQGGNLRVLSSTSFGIDLGGSIALGGQYTSGFYLDFAQIAGRKENATDNNTAGYLAFATRPNGGNTTERMRIDSSGKVGIGTNNPGAKLTVQLGNIGIDQDGAANQFFGAAGNVAGTNTTGGVLTVFGHAPNAYADTSVPPYDGTNFVGAAGLMARGFSESAEYRGSLEFFTKTGSTANATSRMIITHDGNVGIGTPSPSVKFNVVGGRTALAANSETFALGLQYSSSAGLYYIGASNSATPDLLFSQVGGSERMRLTNAGELLVGVNAPAGSRFYSLASSTSEGSGYFRNSATSGITSDQVQIGVGQAAGTGYHFIRAYSAVFSTPVVQFAVRGDGTVYAQNTTIQSLSDARVKENVRDADNGLETILGLRPVRFDFKEGYGNNRKNQLGFIAQEVEAVFPDAVDNAGDKDENGDPYKSVGPGALIPVLVKAIQELKAEFDAYKLTHP